MSVRGTYAVVAAAAAGYASVFLAVALSAAVVVAAVSASVAVVAAGGIFVAVLDDFAHVLLAVTLLVREQVVLVHSLQQY